MMTPTSRDILLLAIGAILSYLMLSIAAHYLAPEKPCGFDGQPDAHWQAEFNKLDHEWRMYGYCLESKKVEECKREWGK